ncbi:nucleotide exchange factor GrpE [Candidatus Gottesmanbacteria bacterium]|nr:nucleotide exchange factor GrpE [Candidatus Gottesmanbacteria bacterium]
MNDTTKQQIKKKQTDQTDELQKQIEEWKGKYLRVLADYQNLEKRAAEEKTELWNYAAEGVFTKLLPVLDTFARAQAHLQDAGLSLALKELGSTLESLGVARLDVDTKQFDPESMECIEVVEGPDGIVTEEVSPGYALHGKVIRVARVKVGKQNKFEARSTNFETNPNDQN